MFAVLQDALKEGFQSKPLDNYVHLSSSASAPLVLAFCEDHLVLSLLALQPTQRGKCAQLWHLSQFLDPQCVFDGAPVFLGFPSAD